jgi:hypothetical protein
MAKETKVTKEGLIRQIKVKGNKASPLVKKIAFSGLSHMTKPELSRMLRKMRVTRNGDIDYT